MAVNLNPPEALIAFPHQLSKGKLVRIPLTASGSRLEGQVLEFQYNPETITRTRTGKWESRNRRRQGGRPSPQEVRSRSGQGSAALMADSETISMKIIFDATEAILAATAANSEAETEGISQYLAALELIPMGKSEDRERPREAVQPVRPDQLLLILGNRYFPVVITSLTIVEQKFSPTLVPIRAEVDLKMNVLETAETAYSEWIRLAFDNLRRQRETKARGVYSANEAALSAIENALNQGSQQ